MAEGKERETLVMSQENVWLQACQLSLGCSSKAETPLALTCCRCPVLDFYIIALAITMHALFMWLAIMEKRQAIYLSKHIRMHDFKSESPRLIRSYNKCTFANMLASCSLRRPLYCLRKQ